MFSDYLQYLNLDLEIQLKEKSAVFFINVGKIMPRRTRRIKFGIEEQIVFKFIFAIDMITNYFPIIFNY